MNIASMMGTSTSSALEALYGERKKQQQDGDGSQVSSWKQDTVSLSAEALALAKALEAKNGREGSEQEENFAAGEEQAEQENSAAGAAGGGGGGSGDSITELEAKIKELQAKIASVQSSNVPDESKEAMIAGLQAEINAAMQELNALKAQAA